MLRTPLPTLGLAAPGGTGKTTLLIKIVPLLRARGLRIAVLKHSHHDFEIDQPGKDSYVLRRSGAVQTLIASRGRRALVTETPCGPEPRLSPLLAELHAERLDVVLVEGWHRERIPRIELHRPALGHAPMYPRDPCVIAVAADAPLGRDCALPLLDLNDPQSVARFVLRWLRGAQGPAGGAML